MVFQRRVGRKNIISSSSEEPGFALIRVPFSRRSKHPIKTLYTTDTHQRGGSGDAGVEGGPVTVHDHPSVARRAKQVQSSAKMPKPHTFDSVSTVVRRSTIFRELLRSVHPNIIQYAQRCRGPTPTPAQFHESRH